MLPRANPRVCVVVLNHNGWPLLGDCLDSIYEGLQENGQQIPADVFVVDNASQDNSVEMVSKRYPACRLILNQVNEGFARAINKGVTYCNNCDFVLVSNSDVIYRQGSIWRMVEYLVANPTVGVVGPQLLFPNGGWQRSYGAFPSIPTMLSRLLLVESVTNAIKRTLWPRIKLDRFPKAVPYVDGAAMLVRKTLFDQLQGFDESFFFYAEDADFCFRAWIAGSKVMFLPSAQVVHVRGGTTSTKAPEAVIKLWLEANFHFIRKWFGKRRAGIFIKLNKIYSLERLLIAVLRLKRKEATRWYQVYKVTRAFQVQQDATRTK